MAVDDTVIVEIGYASQVQLQWGLLHSKMTARASSPPRDNALIPLRIATKNARRAVLVGSKGNNKTFSNGSSRNNVEPTKTQA